MRPIGKLRHRLRLEEAVETADGAGGVDLAWATVATLWARLEPLRADERVRAGRPEEAATHRVTIRRREGVAGGMRFSIGNRVFAIRGVVEDGERGRFLECLCEEIGT